MPARPILPMKPCLLPPVATFKSLFTVGAFTALLELRNQIALDLSCMASLADDSRPVSRLSSPSGRHDQDPKYAKQFVYKGIGERDVAGSKGPAQQTTAALRCWTNHRRAEGTAPTAAV